MRISDRSSDVCSSDLRQGDIAARLGVAQPTVAKMLKRLVKAGFVVQKPYRGAFLTPEGEALAQASRERHQVVQAFLLALGNYPDTARRDAPRLEPHVSAQTIAACARRGEARREGWGGQPAVHSHHRLRVAGGTQQRPIPPPDTPTE